MYTVKRTEHWKNRSYQINYRICQVRLKYNIYLVLKHLISTIKRLTKEKMLIHHSN